MIVVGVEGVVAGAVIRSSVGETKGTTATSGVDEAPAETVSFSDRKTVVGDTCRDVVVSAVAVIVSKVWFATKTKQNSYKYTVLVCTSLNIYSIFFFLFFP